MVHGGHKLLHHETSDDGRQVFLTPGFPVQHLDVVICRGRKKNKLIPKRPQGARAELEVRKRGELTGDGRVEVFKVLDVPGTLGGGQALVIDLQEVPQRQLHVRHGGAEVFAVVGAHGTHKQRLHRQTHTDAQKKKMNE